MAYKVGTATKHLRKDDATYPGCPTITNGILPEPVPTLWLMYLWDLRCSKDTIKTYAFAFRGWLNWLQFRKLEWWDVTIDDFHQYRRVLSSKRANSSTNVSLAAICSFYKWAHKRFMPVLPFDMATTQRGRTREVALVKRCVVSETVPRIHTTEQFDAILAHNPRKSPGLVFRDELVAELGRFSGLRRMEIAALSIPQLDSAVSKGSFFTLQITCTKGSRPRTIFLHSDTMSRLRRYIEIYRPTKVQAGGTGRAYPTEIFLTQNGRPLRREYITATWKLASKAAGSTSTFHWTRADFVTAVVREADSAGLNSMRIAQDLAGHASESTTARYVRTCVAETTHPWANDLISEMYHGNKNK